MTRTVVVTGASSGVGLAAARLFAQRGDHVVMTGRDPQRLADAATQVRAAGDGREPDAVRADFAVLDDVRRLAAHVRDTYPKVDVLANNAGGIPSSYRCTVDGFESTIQGNHLAAFLLTGLLRERLRDGRVVNTASDAHARGDLDPDDFVSSPERFRMWQAYGGSKAANIAFAAEAARRWPDIVSVSFHPGVVRSNFGESAMFRLFYRYAPFLTTPEKAGALLVWLATADGVTDGAYYVGHKPARPRGKAGDPAVAARLWETSTKAVRL
ncbi:SDR family NAD(P)-dependent oxidoreductase [Krasilnikovia sp. MM14-A1259]|uniref:SDR family NAD(P)-dependent oxidoreductase n=1 Tax=Krasilnikovia sp. MM14-A1259 TaxID=3373539 RepID=UPI003805E851